MKAEKLLLVERVMKFMPWTVQPSDSVAHARALLDDQRINNFPVISKGKLVGVVSARDLEASTLSPKKHANKRDLEIHPDRVRVASVMTTTVHPARPKDTLAAAAILMRREHVRALPVMEEGHLRGIVNYRDIIATLSVPGGTVAKSVKLHRRILSSKRLLPNSTIAKHI
jgi:CBS domain-containing protein